MEINKDGKKFVPHVIEVAYGVDRPFYCSLESTFVEEEGEKPRTYFKLPKDLAPYRAAVFPLVKKDGIPEKAREIFNLIKDAGYYAQWDKSGSIGRRYARADEVGIPFCVTVDYDSLKDDTVTVRDRDSMEQKRVKVDELVGELK
jgi:glycyl-tRNA synthetase